MSTERSSRQCPNDACPGCTRPKLEAKHYGSGRRDAGTWWCVVCDTCGFTFESAKSEDLAWELSRRQRTDSASPWSIVKTSCRCNREDDGHGWAVLFNHTMVRCLGCLRDIECGHSEEVIRSNEREQCAKACDEQAKLYDIRAQAIRDDSDRADEESAEDDITANEDFALAARSCAVTIRKRVVERQRPEPALPPNVLDAARSLVEYIDANKVEGDLTPTHWRKVAELRGALAFPQPPDPCRESPNHCLNPDTVAGDGCYGADDKCDCACFGCHGRHLLKGPHRDDAKEAPVPAAASGESVPVPAVGVVALRDVADRLLMLLTGVSCGEDVDELAGILADLLSVPSSGTPEKP